MKRRKSFTRAVWVMRGMIGASYLFLTKCNYKVTKHLKILLLADTFLLSRYYELHQEKNVFVTHGAWLNSVANINRSLSFKGLTAKSANYTIEHLKEGVL